MQGVRMPAVQSSWTLPIFDNVWFFKLNKNVGGGSNAAADEAKLSSAADFLRLTDQSAKCDFVGELQSRSSASLTVASKEFSARGESCDKATLSCESAKCDLKEMTKVFQSFDENTDDRICAKDLRRYMSRLGYHMSEEEARSMVASVDRDGDGSVDFDELFSLYLSLVEQQEEDEEETLMEAFQVFDKNTDGFITAKELQAVFLDLGMPEGKSLKSCEEMIRSVAPDGSGEIDVIQFKQMMQCPTFTGTVYG